MLPQNFRYIEIRAVYIHPRLFTLPRSHYISGNTALGATRSTIPHKKVNIAISAACPTNRPVISHISGNPRGFRWGVKSRPRFNIKMTFYEYRKSHCGDETVVRSSYLNNGITYTDKMTFLYWTRALDTDEGVVLHPFQHNELAIHRGRVSLRNWAMGGLLRVYVWPAFYLYRWSVAVICDISKLHLSWQFRKL